jgi:hypothetical protein
MDHFIDYNHPLRVFRLLILLAESPRTLWDRDYRAVVSHWWIKP